MAAPTLDVPEDRLNEAHFFLHAMEATYHRPDPFRFHLNAFLRALKEVPQLTQMAVQNVPELVAWLRPEVQALRGDPLVDYVFRQRDFVVHRNRLVPRSTAFLGITEGRGLKWGISVPIDPMRDSDAAMQAYLITVKASGDFFQLLDEDEESVPCVKRQWVLDDFPDRELIALAADAWARVGGLLQAARAKVGLAPIDLSLACRHSAQEVQLRTYDRAQLRQWVDQARPPGA